MVSAAAYAPDIQEKMNVYKKRFQGDKLRTLLRKINTSKNRQELLLKFQKVQEIFSNSKSEKAQRLVERLGNEILGDGQKATVSGDEYKAGNPFTEDRRFKKLFPKADVLFSTDQYGVAAREALRETIKTHSDDTAGFFDPRTFFPTRTSFRGYLVQNFKDTAFDGIKGVRMDLYF